MPSRVRHFAPNALWHLAFVFGFLTFNASRNRLFHQYAAKKLHKLKQIETD
jgi:hypothetical protein